MAGHFKLGHLIAFWDNNSIDGASLAVSDNEVKRFRASGWHVQEIDGHDTDAIRDAIAAVRAGPHFKKAPFLPLEPFSFITVRHFRRRP